MKEQFAGVQAAQTQEKACQEVEEEGKKNNDETSRQMFKALYAQYFYLFNHLLIIFRSK